MGSRKAMRSAHAGVTLAAVCVCALPGSAAAPAVAPAVPGVAVAAAEPAAPAGAPLVVELWAWPNPKARAMSARVWKREWGGKEEGREGSGCN